MMDGETERRRWVVPRSCDAILAEVHSWDEFVAAAERLGTGKEANKQKGDLFERLVQLLLRLDTEYEHRVVDVWLYSEIDERLKTKLNLPPKDRGVDLLARTKRGAKRGEYWTIQAKYRSNTVGSLELRELGTFGTQSAAVATGIARGLICTTKQDKTADFAQAKGFVFQHVLLERWESLPSEFWDRVRDVARGNAPRPIEERKPKPYQQHALTKAHRHFVEKDERCGKLIMPCGTGKSLIGYWTAVDTLKARTIVVAVPSLILVRQTLRDWAREEYARGRLLDALVVCSDESTAKEKDGEGDGDLRLDDLDIEVTTKVPEIREWLAKPVNDAATRVVFVTYQSGGMLAKAAGSFTFDVGILDEAHKTAGWEGKAFQHLLRDKKGRKSKYALRIRRRIFMTATERTYDGANDQIVGMNDDAVYGTTYHEMPFGEAIDEGILADYTVLALAVTRSQAEDLRDLITERRYVHAKSASDDDDEEELDLDEMTAEDLATVLALRKAVTDYDLSHAVSFHSRNSFAQAFEQSHKALNRQPKRFGELETYRVSSRLSAGKRHVRLKAFANSLRALMANARCLTEGVDVPAIDLVLFAQPRQSKVDIVQAVGRALRKPDNQPNKRAYVLVPVLVEDGEEDIENVVEGTGFENLVNVLKAMSTTDGNVGEKIQVVLARNPVEGRAQAASDSVGEVAPILVDVKALEEKLRLRAWDRLEGLRTTRLTEEEILRWADAHKKQTGEWPRRLSDRLVDGQIEGWSVINTALTEGLRGLSGGSSLAQLLFDKRGVRNHMSLAPLQESEILRWADAHRTRTGEWPRRFSGIVVDAPTENWNAINASLVIGARGFKGGSSLAQLLAQQRGARNVTSLPSLSIRKILQWADDHRKRAGTWPDRKSGAIVGAPGETWMIVQTALLEGLRGLSGGSSIARLLAEERGVRL